MEDEKQGSSKEKQGSSDEAVLQLTGALGKALDEENSHQEAKEVMDMKSLHAAKGLRDLGEICAR